MGIFKDIMDVAKDTYASNKGAIDDTLSRKQYSSISKMADEGTLQFPVLVTRAIDIETAQMVAKALERNYASFAQIAFSLSPYMNLEKDRDGASFIRNFHQNSDTKYDKYDIMNIPLESSLAEAYDMIVSDDYIFLGAVYEGTTQTIKADNLEQLVDLMESVNDDILNNKYVPKSNIIFNFKDKNLSAKYNNRLLEADNQKMSNKDTNNVSMTIKDRISMQQLKYQKKKDDAMLKQQMARTDLDRSKFEYQKDKDALDYETRYNDKILSQNMLKDNDVKKSNELVPTILHIQVKNVDKNGTVNGITDFLVGIKAILHPIKSDEMVSNVVGACMNNDKVFNFLRWTTGEISFFKDFLFNVKEIKDDVANRAMGSSPWWITLKRRRAMAKIKDSMIIGKRILPNATIVLTAEEAEWIKSNYGYDVMEPFFLNKIMKTYFLLGFVVVDNAQQMVSFMFDGHTTFQTVTFSGLERENSRDEKKFKEMLKVMNRM